MKRVLCFILSIILIMTSTIVIMPSETLAVASVTNFDYTGAVQTFTVPYDGLYTMEVWGAQGGIAYGSYEGGKGAYSKGTVELKTGTTLYVYVGGQGGATGTGTSTGVVAGGFNGGGNGIIAR